MSTKICKVCGKEKLITSFSKDKRLKSRYSNVCASCSAAKTKEWRNKNKGKVKKYYKEVRRSTHYREKYGLEFCDIRDMLREQEHKCAICKKELKFPDKQTHVDHCHTTGKVRGMLCNNCNLGLGYFSDNRHHLSSAIKYLNAQD